MARVKAIGFGDRAVNTETGETATVVDVHDGNKKRGSTTPTVKHYGVLPDGGPKALVVWDETVTERTGFAVRTCKRCNAKNHIAINCPEGDR